MPAAVVNKVSDKCSLSKEKAEAKWKEAKKLAADEGFEEQYDYIMQIFKSLVGKECMKIMGWANESNIQGVVAKYI